MNKKTSNNIRHYASKFIIKRFKNGNDRLYILDVDNNKISSMSLKYAFGEKGLWKQETENRISLVETTLGKILKELDGRLTDLNQTKKCTVFSIKDTEQRKCISKMANLTKILLPELKSNEYEHDINRILNKHYNDEVYFVKLHEKDCDGKFLITDYLSQYIIDIDTIDLSKVHTFAELKSGKLDNKRCSTIPIHFVTGEYEFFFIGNEIQLKTFLDRLRNPTLYIVDDKGKEFKKEKVTIDNFELTAFNLIEINSQESMCHVGSYDKDYLNLIKDQLPTISKRKFMWRSASIAK